MVPFWIASDSLEAMRPKVLARASLGERLLFLIALAGISLQPSAAQAFSECNCKIPSGYTALQEDRGQGCVNKLVACMCAPTGSRTLKSDQYMCLYRVIPGGGNNFHQLVLTPGVQTK